MHCQRCAVNQLCVNDPDQGFPFDITVDETTGDLGCDAGSNNACQQAQCGCNVEKVKKLIKEFNIRGDVEPKTCIDRTDGTNTNNNVCCGIGYKWVQYNADGDWRCEVNTGSGYAELVHTIMDLTIMI